MVSMFVRVCGKFTTKRGLRLRQGNLRQVFFYYSGLESSIVCLTHSDSEFASKDIKAVICLNKKHYAN